MSRFIHTQHELNWAPHDPLTLVIDAHRWRISPTHALWVPAGTPHRVVAAASQVIFPIRFDPQPLPSELRLPVLLRVNEALRWTLMRIVQSHLSLRFDMAREKEHALRLMPALTAPQVHLKLPQTVELRTIAERLLAHPSDPQTVDDWAAAAGMSTRSLQRGFTAETGTSFSCWRTRARIEHALPLLGSGIELQEVARRVGYASVNGLNTAFRRELGRTARECIPA